MYYLLRFLDVKLEKNKRFQKFSLWLIYMLFKQALFIQTNFHPDPAVEQDHQHPAGQGMRKTYSVPNMRSSLSCDNILARNHHQQSNISPAKTMTRSMLVDAAQNLNDFNLEVREPFTFPIYANNERSALVQCVNCSEFKGNIASWTNKKSTVCPGSSDPT